MTYDDNEPARIREFTLYENDFGREDHYVGDSQTAVAIRDLRQYVETMTDQLCQRIDHIASHDPGTNPVPGCMYCEARHAA